MLTEEFKSAINRSFPSATIDEKGQYPVLGIASKFGHDFMHFLKNESFPHFEKLECLSGVDWVDHLEVVYHLDSLDTNETVVVKVIITDRENPVTYSVTDLWKGAELLECEVYDFFGIRFLNHPFLRRLFMTEDWVGYPLRKDYADEINMIKL